MIIVQSNECTSIANISQKLFFAFCDFKSGSLLADCAFSHFEYVCGSLTAPLFSIGYETVHNQLLTHTVDSVVAPYVEQVSVYSFNQIFLPVFFVLV